MKRYVFVARHSRSVGLWQGRIAAQNNTKRGASKPLLIGTYRRWCPLENVRRRASEASFKWHDGLVIVVVEGPSAAGKSSWVATHGSDNVIAETGRIEVPDDLVGDRLATFWSEANCRRWAEAVRVEAKCGLALCDTDPLKLHYAYCLARVGVGAWDDFDFGITEAADAIRQQRLGLADIVLVSIPSDETLERQRDSDSLRRRRNFDLHRQLGPSLSDWYSTLNEVDPGRVRWEFPTTVPAPVARERYDVNLFRAWMDALPRGAGSA